MNKIKYQNKTNWLISSHDIVDAQHNSTKKRPKPIKQWSINYDLSSERSKSERWGHSKLSLQNELRSAAKEDEKSYMSEKERLREKLFWSSACYRAKEKEDSAWQEEACSLHMEILSWISSPRNRVHSLSLSLCSPRLCFALSSVACARRRRRRVAY